MTVTLLGPQRFRISARTVVRSLDVEGPIVAINAGWQERESDDAELGDALGGRMHNLRLYQRFETVLEEDPWYADLARQHEQVLDDQQGLYALRLQHAVESANAVARRQAPTELRDAALQHAIEEIQALDVWHLDVVDSLEAEFEATHDPTNRLAAAIHREEVAEILASAGALVLTGGHVGVLLECLRLLVPPVPAELPIVAWSAGAMAIGERIVLFNDAAVQGSTYAEVYRRGLGLYTGVIPLPHARRRLRLNDPVRVAALARRFNDACCLVLDDGVRVALPAEGGCPPGFPVLSVTGQVTTGEAA